MSEPLWTRDEIARATGGAAGGAPFAATGVSIDTRTLQPGDLFVALAGERDGHGFVDQALARGAAGALVSREVGGPAVVVPDTLRALERLGVAARDRTPARRCAVTGSVGKTGVTQAIAAGLRLAGPAHAAVESYNNHIGVPLTLARMPRGTERAVFELGMNHAGEIGPLSRLVAPHVAVITTVGAVHVENFPDGETGVARAKAELFEGLAPGGAAVLNADNRWFELLAKAARSRGARVLAFGSGAACDARLLSLETKAPSVTARSRAALPPPQAGEDDRSHAPPFTGELSAAQRTTEGAFVRARIHGQELTFPIAQSGAHWGLNSLAVLLALGALGVSLGAGVEALAGFAPLAGRGAEQRVEGPAGAFTLIDESYNANPMSLRAALASLARRAPARRIAVVTDMLELGPEAAALHAALAPVAAEAAELVFTAGPLARALHDALPAGRRGGWASDADALAPQIARALRDGDVVMVKGSKGSYASRIVAALVALDHAPAAADAVRAGVSR